MAAGIDRALIDSAVAWAPVSEDGRSGAALERVALPGGQTEVALDLALLAGLTWLGWNEGLDIVEHPDDAARARERAGLDWWLAQAARALERGVV